jgi:hypothetical protein
MESLLTPIPNSIAKLKIIAPVMASTKVISRVNDPWEFSLFEKEVLKSIVMSLLHNNPWLLYLRDDEQRALRRSDCNVYEFHQPLVSYTILAFTAIFNESGSGVSRNHVFSISMPPYDWVGVKQPQKDLPFRVAQW